MSDSSPPETPPEQPAQPPVDELFGEEELGLPPPQSEGQRRGTPVRAVVVGVAILVVGALWYFASLNHERYFLKVKKEMVRVERGYYFPLGSGAWTPTPAYEPFKLPPGIAPEKSGAMSIEELDQVLLKLFLTIAERELSDLAAGNVDLAERMVKRANKLRSLRIGDPIEEKLMVMQGDVAFRRGLTEVRGLQNRFDEALKHFRRAAMHGGVSYTGADKWVEAISRLREEFRRLSKESGLDPDQILANPPKLSPDGERAVKPRSRPARPPKKAPDAGAR